MLIVDQKVYENSGLHEKKQLRLKMAGIPVRHRPFQTQSFSVGTKGVPEPAR